MSFQRQYNHEHLDILPKWNIDYNNPAKYLEGGRQTTFDEKYSRRLKDMMANPQKNLTLVKRIYKFKEAFFDNSYHARGRYIGKHTVNDIMEKEALTGCHDHGLIMAGMLRLFGIPSIMIDTTLISGAVEYNNEQSGFIGHVFVEFYLNNKWYLLDSSSGDLTSNYDTANPLIPSRRDSEGFYAMLKGLDSNDCGIYCVEDLMAKQIETAKIIKKEHQNFKLPQYNTKNVKMVDY